MQPTRNQADVRESAEQHGVDERLGDKQIELRRLIERQFHPRAEGNLSMNSRVISRRPGWVEFYIRKVGRGFFVVVGVWYDTTLRNTNACCLS